MTQGEIAVATGKSTTRIQDLCKEYSIKCITKEERHKRFIQANPALTKKELIEILGLSEATLWKYEREMGIKIPVDCEIRTPEPKKVIPSYRKEQEDGLLDVAVQVFEGMTKEEKQWYIKNYL